MVSRCGLSSILFSLLYAYLAVPPHDIVIIVGGMIWFLWTELPVRNKNIPNNLKPHNPHLCPIRFKFFFDEKNPAEGEQLWKQVFFRGCVIVIKSTRMRRGFLRDEGRALFIVLLSS